MDVLRKGLSVAFKGARIGNTALTGMGAALAAIGLARRIGRPKRELLWAKTLKPGQSYRIRLLGSEDEIQIDG